MTQNQVILATTSQFKAKQLLSLKVKFTLADPCVIEYHDNSQSTKELAIYLAQQKAMAIRTNHPKQWIIGSDQTAINGDGLILTKPGTQDKAMEQLNECQGKKATFYSAVCLLKNDHCVSWAVETNVQFRALTLDEIKRYIKSDKPEQCAGSFKIESLGIALFESVESKDPTALVGLPLMSLAKELRNIGFQVP